MSEPRPPALRDVAARAGVSAQTVSRVLNGHAHVSATTRHAVERAIAELGYRRNMAARALKTGRPSVIGVLAPSSAMHGPAAMVGGLVRAARAASMTCTVDHPTALTEPAIAESVDRLVSHGIAGLFVVFPYDAAAAILAAAVPPGIPMVVVDGEIGVAAPVVGVDQHAGAILAVEHLLGLGHRSVWHVAGPEGWHGTRSREAGWREALRRAGIEPSPPLRGDWTARSGYEAGRMLATSTDCTAVFVANDAMALGVMAALRDAGRRVPDDVSVVGFDDVAESEFFVPPLTTVHQDFGAVGRAGLELLLKLIDDRADRQVATTFLPTTLVLRRSTQPPAINVAVGPSPG